MLSTNHSTTIITTSLSFLAGISFVYFLNSFLTSAPSMKHTFKESSSSSSKSESKQTKQSINAKQSNPLPKSLHPTPKTLNVNGDELHLPPKLKKLTLKPRLDPRTKKIDGTFTSSSVFPLQQLLLPNNSSTSMSVTESQSNSTVDSKSTHKASMSTSTSKSMPSPLSQTQSKSKSNSNVQSQPHVEVLIHNISHSDLILSIESFNKTINDISSSIPSSANNKNDMYLATPRFSAFNQITLKALDCIDRINENTVGNNKLLNMIAYSPVISDSNSPDISERGESGNEKDGARSARLPSGFNIPIPSSIADEINFELTQEDLSNLRFRGSDLHRFTTHDNGGHGEGDKAATNDNTKYAVTSVHFPIITTLLPRFEGMLRDKYGEEVVEFSNDPLFFISNSNSTNGVGVEGGGGIDNRLQKVIILISGQGTPRNTQHTPVSNSTYPLSLLLKQYINVTYPAYKVVLLDSSSNGEVGGRSVDLFKFEDNLRFVKGVFRRVVEGLRDLCGTGGDVWTFDKSNFTSPTTANSADNNTSSYSTSSDNNETPLKIPPPPSHFGPNPYSKQWRKFFNVTLSFANGSTARQYAIQSAVRDYRPRYMHFWDRKGFWFNYGRVILGSNSEDGGGGGGGDEDEGGDADNVEEGEGIGYDKHQTPYLGSQSPADIEIYNFEEMETLPPTHHLDIDQTNFEGKCINLLVSEMRKFKDEFLLEGVGGGIGDLNDFWLRKSKQPVLSILLVRHTPSNTIKVYRGTNMEVSMPTGSLCAERNVIGSALSDFCGVRREDLCMVGVLGLDMIDGGKGGNVVVCKNVNEFENEEGNADLSLGLDTDMPQLKQTKTKTKAKTKSNEVDITPSRKVSLRKYSDSYANNGSGSGCSSSSEDLAKSKFKQTTAPTTKATSSLESIPATLKPEAISNKSQPNNNNSNSSNNNKYIKIPTNSINPLKPCGSCNEWLKKISEPNPSFKVVTFTDCDCFGVYVSGVTN